MGKSHGPMLVKIERRKMVIKFMGKAHLAGELGNIFADIRPSRVVVLGEEYNDDVVRCLHLACAWKIPVEIEDPQLRATLGFE